MMKVSQKSQMLQGVLLHKLFLYPPLAKLKAIIMVPFFKSVKNMNKNGYKSEPKPPDPTGGLYYIIYQDLGSYPLIVLTFTVSVRLPPAIRLRGSRNSDIFWIKISLWKHVNFS